MDISHHGTRDCTPMHATLAVQILAIPSQFQIFQPSHRQKADAKSLGIRSKLSQFFLHRLCIVLGEALQVFAPKTKAY